MELFQNLGSKGDVLINLQKKLKTARVEDIHVFTVREWGINRSQVLMLLVKKFSPRLVVVRSSSALEDTSMDSQAGCFRTETGVDSSSVDILSSAVERVIESYRERKSLSEKDQVIVQAQTISVKVSGVIFTRSLGTNSPYYVINYDDTSGKTDTVTGGTEGNMVCVFRSYDMLRESRWKKLFVSVKEIESLFPGIPLDIEFAITKEDEIVIFQTRALSANLRVRFPDEDQMRGLIDSMKAKFLRFSRPVPHLGGRRTIFGDMPDWNPAEMIGARPNTLDYTLYSFLITDSVWHEARSTLGYRDVYPGELMVSFGKRPYIDTRLSFNSFIPADIGDELCDKLVNYYLDRLESNPEKQDKVEFEIVWSCFNFSLPRELKDLERFGFTQDEIGFLKSSLLKLTKKIVSDKNIFDRDLELVKHLNIRKEAILEYIDKEDDSAWANFTIAYNLLQNCKKFGILPFARLARLAFIGKSILVSLREEGVITQSAYHGFLNSIQTVASMFSDDLECFKMGGMDRKEFFSKYGHLRPGTYDITAPRYIDIGADLFAGFAFSSGCKDNRKLDYVFSCEEEKAVTRIMFENGFSGGSETLFEFISKAISFRETAKLEFTRTLSAALEFLAKAGGKLGFTREDICNVDVNTLLKFRNPEYSDTDYARSIISQSRDRHKKEKEWSDLLILPPVILSEGDFEFVSFYRARPNFITDKTVQASIRQYERDEFLKAEDLRGSIVLLENADPGYDWIFAKQPSGVITKYGGVASHMAIRCAEFGIPAAIGCGETLFDKILKSKTILLDCRKQFIQKVQGMKDDSAY